jgi:hypothetical protein
MMGSLKGAKKTLNLQGLQDYVGVWLGFVPKSDFSFALDAAFSFPDRASLDAGRMFLFANKGKLVWHEHPWPSFPNRQYAHHPESGCCPTRSQPI